MCSPELQLFSVNLLAFTHRWVNLYNSPDLFNIHSLNSPTETLRLRKPKNAQKGPDRESLSVFCTHRETVTNGHDVFAAFHDKTNCFDYPPFNFLAGLCPFFCQMARFKRAKGPGSD